MLAARGRDVAPLPLAEHRDDVERVEPLEHRATRLAHLAERLVGAGEMGVVHDVRRHHVRTPVLEHEVRGRLAVDDHE